MVKIYFDLDGTLFNLYGKSNWLETLRNEESGAFRGGVVPELAESWGAFQKICMALISYGVQFGVISWLPMQCSDEYGEICRKEKLEWIQENIPFSIENNIIPYGTIKQDAIQKHAKTEILIDDNRENCEMWKTAKRRIAYQVDEGFSAYEVLQYIYEEVLQIGEWN